MDEDSEFYTSEGDTLTYGDVISAIDAMCSDNEDEDSEEDEGDIDTGDDPDEDDDTDYYL